MISGNSHALLQLINFNCTKVIFYSFRFHIDPHQEWKLTPDGQIVSAMLPNLYLTSISDLRVEKMQDAKVNEDEPIAKMSSLSSSSDSSDSDSSLKLGEGV